MTKLFQIYSLDNPLNDFLKGLEAWCVAFNEFAVIFFGYMKYILVLILLGIGILTLLKLRGVYIHERLNQYDTSIKETYQLQKPRLMLGTAYIGIALGILFNYFTLF